MRAHHGSLQVFSGGVGCGSTFSVELPCFVADPTVSDEENAINIATGVRLGTCPLEALNGYEKGSYRSASFAIDEETVKMESKNSFSSRMKNDNLSTFTSKRLSSELDCKESDLLHSKISMPLQHLPFPVRDTECDVKPISALSSDGLGRHDLQLVSLNTQHNSPVATVARVAPAKSGQLATSLSLITALGTSHTRVGVLKFDDTSTDGDTTGLAGESFRQHTAGMNTQLKSSQNNKLKSSHRKRFLVVDDVALNRKMLSRFLVSRDCDVEEASDGVEAVEKVRLHMGTQEEYDVITMDYQMPVMDGPTATRLIRDMGYQGLIVGVTGNALADDVGTFVSNGVNTVFVKPLDVQAFFDYLSTHNSNST